jgi:hypothetical protein
LVELTGGTPPLLPKTDLIAIVSILSLYGVDVPWALT